MKKRYRKSLDDCLDNSDEFESQLKRQSDAGASIHADDPLVLEIVDWLQDCAWQGRFLLTGSPERRALMSLLHRWSSLLRRSGIDADEINELADFDENAGIVLTEGCPYPGLAPYDSTMGKRFFGREELVEEAIEHLTQGGNQILFIIGGSGSGKSSLARAGILPQLKEKFTAKWLFAPILTPGTEPLEELAKSVAAAIGDPTLADKVLQSISDKPKDAYSTLAGYCKPKSLLLVIDQFEELLTLCQDDNEKRIFAEVLNALSEPSATAGEFRCRTLLTMRSDHLPRFEENADLRPLYDRLACPGNHLHLSSMGFESIRRAIKVPADEVGLRFIPATLIDGLASETAGLSSGLPLLQFALRRLWDSRRDEGEGRLDFITQKMISDLPNVEGALGKVADEIFSTFSASQKAICERLLLELVVLDESFEEPLRRRRKESELHAALEKLGSPEDVKFVIDEFCSRGLLRRYGEQENFQLEVAHEALLRRWEHINSLITGREKDRLLLIKQIAAESREWVRASSERKKEYLGLKGERLERAGRDEKDGWLARGEMTEYVKACEEQAKEEKRRNKNYATLKFGFIALAVFLAVAIAIYSYKLNSIINDSRHIADNYARQANILVDTDPYAAMLFAIEAYRGYSEINVNMVQFIAYQFKKRMSSLSSSGAESERLIEKSGTIMICANIERAIERLAQSPLPGFSSIKMFEGSIKSCSDSREAHQSNVKKLRSSICAIATSNLSFLQWLEAVGYMRPQQSVSYRSTCSNLPHGVESEMFDRFLVENKNILIGERNIVVGERNIDVGGKFRLSSLEYFQWASKERNTESQRGGWNAKKMNGDLEEAVAIFKNGDLEYLEKTHVKYHTYVQRNMSSLIKLMSESVPQQSVEESLNSRIAHASYQLNQICRCAIGNGQEDQIGQVCNTMVILQKGDASEQYRYERGLVFALNQEYAKARNDFEAYKKWLKSISVDSPASQGEGEKKILMQLNDWLHGLSQEPPHFELSDEVRHAYQADCSREYGTQQSVPQQSDSVQNGRLTQVEP